MLYQVQMTTLLGVPDQIIWRWIANKSAFQKVQSICCLNIFDRAAIWKDEAGGKHKFFAWHMGQSKLLTAEC